MIAKTRKTSLAARNVILILDNIRSVHNVGSIFRTAETLGISQIYCVDTTPTPFDRFGRKRADFVKVALGAEDILKWQYVSDGVGLVKKLKKEKLKREKFQVIALEQSAKSVDYKNIEVSGRVAIILGNEVEGVSAGLLKLADVIAEIPMLGKKESLNVSVAGAVFLFRLLDR